METSTPSTSEKARAIVYSRPGCHLCEEAKQAIESAQCANEYTLEEIDIESDVVCCSAIDMTYQSSPSMARKHSDIR
jgi:glutaredoxin